MIKKKVQIRGKKYTFVRVEGITEHQQFVDECPPFDLKDKDGNVEVDHKHFADVNYNTVSYIILDRRKVIAIRCEEYLDEDEIESLYTTVHLSYRNLGIGSRLLEETFKSARERGIGLISFKFYSKKAHKIIQKIQKRYPEIEVHGTLYYVR